MTGRKIAFLRWFLFRKKTDQWWGWYGWRPSGEYQERVAVSEWMVIAAMLYNSRLFTGVPEEHLHRRSKSRPEPDGCVACAQLFPIQSSCEASAEEILLMDPTIVLRGWRRERLERCKVTYFSCDASLIP